MVVKLLSEGKLALSVRYASEGMSITAGNSDITEMVYRILRRRPSTLKVVG